MYRVIADDLGQQIDSGELPAGAQLKTEVELREEYGRSGALTTRTTVRDAIKLLVARGLVETRPGHGTFVRRRTDPFVSKLTADPKFVTGRAATRLLEAGDIEGGVVDYLRGLGIDQVGWRDQFFVRPPDANERAFFNLSDRVQVAMLDVRRTGYDEEGNPIRVTVTVYPGDRNQFEMEAGEVPPSTPSPPSARSASSSEPIRPVRRPESR